jgi:hypothetical protein
MEGLGSASLGSRSPLDAGARDTTGSTTAAAASEGAATSAPAVAGPSSEPTLYVGCRGRAGSGDHQAAPLGPASAQGNMPDPLASMDDVAGNSSSSGDRAPAPPVAAWHTARRPDGASSGRRPHAADQHRGIAGRLPNAGGPPAVWTLTDADQEQQTGQPATERSPASRGGARVVMGTSGGGTVRSSRGHTTPCTTRTARTAEVAVPRESPSTGVPAPRDSSDGVITTASPRTAAPGDMHACHPQAGMAAPTVLDDATPAPPAVLRVARRPRNGSVDLAANAGLVSVSLISRAVPPLTGAPDSTSAAGAPPPARPRPSLLSPEDLRALAIGHAPRQAGRTVTRRASVDGAAGGRKRPLDGASVAQAAAAPSASMAPPPDDASLGTSPRRPARSGSMSCREAGAPSAPHDAARGWRGLRRLSSAVVVDVGSPRLPAADEGVVGAGEASGDAGISALAATTTGQPSHVRPCAADDRGQQACSHAAAATLPSGSNGAVHIAIAPVDPTAAVQWGLLAGARTAGSHSVHSGGSSGGSSSARVAGQAVFLPAVSSRRASTAAEVASTPAHATTTAAAAVTSAALELLFPFAGGRQQNASPRVPARDD